MRKTVKVWFNHWFSTAYYIIDLLKKDEEIDFHVVGSNENPDSVIKLVCNEWFVEPSFSNDDYYVEFCINFCKTNSIEVFVPRRGMQAISKSISLFDEIGVKVLVERDFNKLATLNDKEKTYNLFNNLGIGYIPPRYVVNNVDDFKLAYKTITDSFERACFKLTKDEGATSFRVIDTSMQGYGGLFKQPGMKMTLDATLAALSEKEHFPELLVMPYLKGYEVSIDCLNTISGLISVPRIKVGSRIAEIRYDDEFMKICNDFFNKVDISGPCNIQLKYHDDTPYLLEVNTRMSGGIQLSCIGAGINIPNIAVNQLIGREKSWSMDYISRKVSYVEMPVIL